MVKLVFKNRAFTEGKEESGDAVLLLDESTQSGRLDYSPDAGLIIRRTARRQAESICKTGFLLATGKRVGAGFSLLDDDAERSIDDRLLQEGHKYR